MVILLSAATLWVIIAVLVAVLIGRSIHLANRRARHAAPPPLPVQEPQLADDTAPPRLDALPQPRTRSPAARVTRHLPHGRNATGPNRGPPRK